MKTLISVALVLFVTSTVYAQGQPDVVYTARTLFAGTVMSARTAAAALDDTTRAFSTNGFENVYVHIVTAANDSSCTRLAYCPSADGQTWGVYTLFDSLSTTGTVGANRAFALPAGAMGAAYVRIRVYGSDANIFSANPSTTVQTIIRKKIGN